jgi:hypothetical protein
VEGCRSAKGAHEGLFFLTFFSLQCMSGGKETKRLEHTPRSRAPRSHARRRHLRRLWLRAAFRTHAGIAEKKLKKLSPMTDLSQLGALVATVAFTTAALYVSLVEHPARSRLDPAAELQQWKPSYKRAAVFQVILLTIGSACSWSVYRATGDPGWKVGATLLFANLPWTLLAIMPVNRALLATARGDARTRAALVDWVHLHHCRTALGLLASGTLVTTMAAK